MDFTGRPMKGYVYVSPDGLRTAAAIKKRVDLSMGFVTSVERKPKAKRKAPAAKR
jgi:hypothetical protein